ncbi:DUF2268 domain-containing putative Zn-dependent protease [Flavobacterium sp. MC2016-06]|uniref:gliding motility protein GldB-related protein n=1 Tax=Flavobacterium sp. MC2016-06 TaxID=2676308 RepID=UPI0012BB1331|nr:DUF2268 domain-containing putative Zn-dependent protease [Flavobacterium sp. MC2016-06]MBU3859624.1 DUF2268 domain-containing protein [Flavobacterium sp. MC2016-06]
MKNKLSVLICLIVSTLTFGQNFKQQFISTDIDNFWNAYDKIVSVTDTVLQKKYLKEFYIDKGTEGLKNLIEVRNYTEKDFLNVITNRPKFWNSIRQNTLDVKSHYAEIETAILKLKTQYPDLKPAVMYFSIGAFRTPGTTYENKVLIGSEFSLGAENTVVEELPKYLHSYYKQYKPLENLALLSTHEYIHTQQKESNGSLLSNCLREGIAEFISCKVTEKKSNSPAIDFGKANQEAVINQFVKDLYLISYDYNWLWGENKNQLKERDLGYYIGYEIAERYYNSSKDKSKAIKELIELDYSKEKEIAKITDASHLFPKRLKELNTEYEKQRPTVASIQPLIKGNKKLKSGLTKITIFFSEPLNGRSTGIDFGPLGKDYFPKLSPNRVWSEDKKSITIEADLEPDKQYQFFIDNTFRKDNQVRLKPYLIEFSTEKK